MMNLTPGVTASRSHTVTDEDVRAFVALVDDNNPVHTDDAFAERTRNQSAELVLEGEAVVLVETLAVAR